MLRQALIALVVTAGLVTVGGDDAFAAGRNRQASGVPLAGVAISLVADVPHDHQWWDGDRSQWIDEHPDRSVDAWWPVIHRPKAGA